MQYVPIILTLILLHTALYTTAHAGDKMAGDQTIAQVAGNTTDGEHAGKGLNGAKKSTTDNTRFWITVIVATFGLFGTAITGINGYVRIRVDKERFAAQRELETLQFDHKIKLENEQFTHQSHIETRKISHEEIKWYLELHSQFERTLFDMRIRTYPEVFTALEALSHHNIAALNKQSAKNLADKLNKYGYSEFGLCTLPDTQKSLFEVRKKITQYIKGDIKAKDLCHGERTDLIEHMKRDLNHSASLYRDFGTTLRSNIQQGVDATTSTSKAKAEENSA